VVAQSLRQNGKAGRTQTLTLATRL